MPKSKRYHTFQHSVGARFANHTDYILLALVVIMCLCGLLMLYDASVVVADRLFDDKYHFVTQQAIFLMLGLAGLLVTSKIDYHVWQSLAPLLLLGGLGLLVAVFIPGLGLEVLGARRWLKLGSSSFTLQPSYLLCFALIAYLASWLGGERPDKWSFRTGYVPFGILMGFILMVVALLQRDLGSASILALTSLSMLFLAGAPLWQILTTVGGGLATVTGLVWLEPYRMGRITSFLDRSNDALGSSYHINQALIALGSGGWLGLGLGQSRQKYSYLPEVQTDSIFAIIGEELGYVGALVIIGAFVYLVWRGMRIAAMAPDPFGKLLVGGITSLIGIQVFVNLFAIAAIIPLTGIPLPFFSSGGTSLIVLLSSIGIVLNVSRQAVDKSN
jgi:cell division protein FtsW